MLQPSADLATELASRYRIEGLLGAGGMAEVWLAYDERHGRRVAVKVIRDDIAAALGAERFLQEIRTTAGLQHPHILPLLDSGVAAGRLYYVTPHVTGDTLRALLDRVGSLTVGEVVPLARQIAAALDHAHRHGVIHRDIKPENIFLADGLPVVADFGIALAAQNANDTRLTRAGMSLGTPSYMSPEQVTGVDVLDGRSDQYSLACLIFELLCGRPPYRGATVQATMVEHVVAAVPPLAPTRGNAPAAVERAIRRALSKSPAERFPSINAFAEALADGSEVTTARTIDSASIVVLPFENLSADPENAFFADGLTEDIITGLSKVRALRIISRSSAMALKNAKRTMTSLSADLNVRYAVEGSVRRAGDQLRISAQLVDASRDAQVWAERYSGTTQDIFELQERLAREIVAALKVTLSPEEDRQLSAREIGDVRIFECCAMARQEIWRVNADGLERARRLVEDALEHFGRSAPLLGMLATVYWSYVNWGIDVDERNVERAEELAHEALSADPESATAHFTLAFIRGSRGQLRESVAHGLRAHAREPTNPDVLLILTAAFGAMGVNERMLQYGRQTSQVDPLMPMSHWVTGWAYMLAGDSARSLSSFERADRIAPAGSVFRMFKGLAHYYVGDLAGARTDFEAFGSVQDFFGMLSRGFAHAIAGREGHPLPELDEATASWAAKDFQYSWHIAQVYALAGMHEAALLWLTTAVNRGMVNYPFLAERDRTLDTLRGEPGFTALLARVKTEWEQYQVLYSR